MKVDSRGTQAAGPTDGRVLRPRPKSGGNGIELDDASLSSVIGKLRTAGCVFAEEEAQILAGAATSAAELEAWLAMRLSGEPLEHVVGWAEFCGLRIRVGPGVFVPRRRTEFLAEEAAALTSPGDVVVDLCCGSGAVGAALLAMVGPLELHAADIDAQAVEWARRNVVGGGQVHQGDLYDALPAALRAKVKVIVANAPYVPSGAVDLMPREARLYEPLHALDGGADGLEVQGRIAAGAREWLAPGGCLLMETGERQAPRTAALFARGGLTPSVRRSDELDATLVVGRRGGAAAD